MEIENAKLVEESRPLHLPKGRMDARLLLARMN